MWQANHSKKMIINGVDLTPIRQTFIQSLPEKVEFIQQSAVDNQLDEIFTFGHKLKGSGATYGIPELTEMGIKIESLKQGFSIQLCHTYILELKQLVDALVKEYTE